MLDLSFEEVVLKEEQANITTFNTLAGYVFTFINCNHKPVDLQLTATITSTINVCSYECKHQPISEDGWNEALEMQAGSLQY